MFWRADPRIDEARRHSGWVQFHRTCGATGLYFDDLEPAARGGYSAVAFRLQKPAAEYLRLKVSDGSGPGVIAAVLSAFDAAVAGGWPIDPAAGDLLRSDARPALRVVPAAAPPELDELLGDPEAPAAPLIEDWELA